MTRIASLNVPHFKQEQGGSCTAACVRMVLAYHGRTHSEDELRQLPEVGSCTVSGAPEGRQCIARGVSPWNFAGPTSSRAPEGRQIAAVSPLRGSISLRIALIPGADAPGYALPPLRGSNPGSCRSLAIWLLA
jgi:hypothetical protein